MDVHRRAFALIIVLAVAAGVFALAVQGGAMMRAALVEAGARSHIDSTRRDAQSAVAIAIAGLTISAESEYDVVGAGGSNSPGASGDSEAPEAPDIPELPEEIRQLLQGMLEDGEGEIESPDVVSGVLGAGGLASVRKGAYSIYRSVGTPTMPITVPVGDREYIIEFRDNTGRVNVNTAEAAQLRRLFVLKGIDESRAAAIADQIIDWRDENAFVSPSGAEKSTYELLGVTIRNAPLASIEELLFLPAVTRNVFDRIADDLTVAGDGPLHVGSASREALLSLPQMTPLLVDQIIAARAAGELNQRALSAILALGAREVEPMVRVDPTSRLLFSVRPADSPSPVFVGEAIVTNSTGVRHIRLRLDAADANGEIEPR